MALVRICDICKKPGTDENLQTMSVVDRKGYNIDFGGIMPGVKRRWSIDICDKCLDAFKALRQEKVLSPAEMFKESED